MKKTIKLRDMTREQLSNLCGKGCEKCPLHIVTTNAQRYCAYVIKDMNCVLSDKFLDQTIEIEVPDLLTEEEKALLNKLIGLSAFKIHGINFIICDGYVLVELITANPCEQNDFFHFKKGMFKGIEETKRYAPSDLGLEDK